MARILAVVLFVLPAALSAETTADLAARAQAALSPTAGTLRVAGLTKPVTVLRDPWGIPHIYAETQDDLFFAQGLVAAQDRLWQLEMWRRSAVGELSEVLGPAAFERDRFARLVRYRGDLDAEYASYAPDAREIVAAFVRGVNAWVAEVAPHRERWPIEAQLTGIAPQPWTPEVVLSRVAAWEVTVNAAAEAQRARLGPAIDWDRLQLLQAPEPFGDLARDLAREPGADLPAIDPAVLALFEALRAPLAFPAGSNNWVVDGTLSATGKPLLANDPHRALRLPSLRSMVHLVGPGWNVIGAGEPALPGVAAGHNERVAFGFTVTGIDQQDLYVEELHPENPRLYRYRGRWEPMRVERERIAVKGEAPREVELAFTVHGPVLHEDRAGRRAWVLRWVGSEPGTAGYLASLALDRAKNWSEFRQALARWKVPSENLVYADVDGTIAWQVAGLAPVRRGWSGLLPVPGDGRFEWQGFLSAAELPGGADPARHFYATANHNILPPGYPHALAFDWGDPSRVLRIEEVLGAPGRKFTVGDFERLQHDEVSRPARTMVAALREVQGIGEPLRPFAALLTGWDGTVGRDAAPAALYEIWMAKLAARLAADAPEAVRPLLLRNLRPSRLAVLLGTPTREWFRTADPRASRDALLRATLEEAVAEAKAKLGPDPAAWRWGALHKATFTHPLSTSPERAALFDLPPVEVGGDGNTVHAAGGENFAVAHGASFREVLDVADWDRSTATNVPGQSGQPGSPHYGDLLASWAEGKYFPLLFSREAVEKAAKDRLVLEPARSGSGSRRQRREGFQAGSARRRSARTRSGCDRARSTSPAGGRRTPRGLRRPRPPAGAAGARRETAEPAKIETTAKEAAMPLIVRAFPLLPGKEHDLRRLATALASTHREAAQEFYRSFRVSRESWHFQETPNGPMVIGVTDLDDDPEVRGREYAESQRPFDRWFKDQIRNLTGIDPDSQPLGPPTEVIFDTKDAAAAAPKPAAVESVAG